MQAQSIEFDFGSRRKKTRLRVKTARCPCWTDRNRRLLSYNRYKTHARPGQARRVGLLSTVR